MIHLATVDSDHTIVIKAIHEVERERGIHIQPANILRGTAVPGQNADMHSFIRLPRKRRPPFHGSLKAAGNRHNRNHDKVLGDNEIMNHGRIRGRDNQCLGQDSLGVHLVNRHICSERASSHVGKENHFAGNRINLGVSCHRGMQLASECPGPNRVQRIRINLVRRVAFLYREQTTGVPEHRSIRQALFINQHEVTVLRLTIERVHRVDDSPTLFILNIPLGGTDPSVAIVDYAILDVEGVNHAVSRKQVVVAARLESLIGAIAIERAIEICGHFPLYNQVCCITLHLDRTPGEVQELVVHGHRFGHFVFLFQVKLAWPNSTPQIKISQYCLFLKLAFATLPLNTVGASWKRRL